MDPEIALYYKEREEKQLFLKREIQDQNYNVAEFAQFLDYKRGKSNTLNKFKTNWGDYNSLILLTLLLLLLSIRLKFHYDMLNKDIKICLIIEKGTDVDTWTLYELEDVVREFKQNYGPMYD